MASKNSNEIKPTEAELEILQILWNNGPSSVRSVNDIMGVKKDVGYTTTLKIMQIMTEKGLTKRNTSERKHIYEAAFPEKAIKQNLINRFVEATFNGSASQLVMQLLGNGNPTKEELEEIKTLIDKIENK